MCPAHSQQEIVHFLCFLCLFYHVYNDELNKQNKLLLNCRSVRVICYQFVDVWRRIWGADSHYIGPDDACRVCYIERRMQQDSITVGSVDCVTYLLKRSNAILKKIQLIVVHVDLTRRWRKLAKSTTRPTELLGQPRIQPPAPRDRLPVAELGLPVTVSWLRALRCITTSIRNSRWLPQRGKLVDIELGVYDKVDAALLVWVYGPILSISYLLTVAYMTRCRYIGVLWLKSNNRKFKHGMCTTCYNLYPY